MSKQGAGVAIGLGMVVVGVAMYVVFGFYVEIETPVIGLRQVGAVVAALGVIELAVMWWESRRKKG